MLVVASLGSLVRKIRARAIVFNSSFSAALVSDKFLPRSQEA